jgi:tubulin-folding cofactor B
MAALTHNDVAKYVSSGARELAHGLVLLNIKHNLVQRHFMEITFDMDFSIEQVKDQLYIVTGTRPQFMEVQYLGQTLEDGQLLKHYNPANYGTLDVIDHDPDSLAKDGGLDDVSKVQKYTMSMEEYQSRPNTYLKWKEEQIKANPQWVAPWVIKQREVRAQEVLQHGSVMTLEEAQAKYPLESRVECSPGGRRGAVKFVGFLGRGPKTYADGFVEPAVVWIGVLLDNPEGRNDGTFQGQRFFEAAMGFGGFFRPQNVEVGDFPVDDPFASSDEEEEL